MQEGAMFFGTALDYSDRVYTLRAQRQGPWRPACSAGIWPLARPAALPWAANTPQAIVAAIRLLVVLLKSALWPAGTGR
jgi:hypothetical protein